MRLPPDGRWLGEQVMLRQLRPADAASVWRALASEGLTEGMLEEAVSDPGEVARRLRSDLQRWSAGDAFALAVVEGDDLVGRVDLRPDPHVPGALNLGFWIARHRWGRGLATDAARVALRVAFLDLGAPQVWAGAASWNAASQAVLRKLMAHREHRDRGFREDGRWVANERYSISLEQWRGTGHPSPRAG